MQSSKEKRFSQGLSDKVKQIRGDSVLLFLSFVLFFYFVYSIFFSERNIFKLIQREQYRSELQQEIQKISKENKALKEKINYLKNDRFFIEKKAREDLGLVKDGEEIYVIVDKNKKVKKKHKRWIDQVIEKYQEFLLR